ncbi:AAA family ATPase [Streptomyces sp. NPDC015171]|uniref:AAA family ATPase n=1 Tax=Streptomyces sp. NPDC015171 TaxID=3364945 RepID=UPI0036FF0775
MAGEADGRSGDDAVQFVVIYGNGHHQAGGPRPWAVLEKDGWDDRGYRTLFNLWIVDSEGNRHDIGAVKIGEFGMDEREHGGTVLPDRFTALSDNFFSVGQDDTYYERLRQLGDDIRLSVLGGLRDMAYDEHILEAARGEEVTRTSLWRFLKPAVVEEQFRRIARGGDRVAPFHVVYRAPAPAAGGGGLELGFDVVPGTKPSSNIHVLTGRNGAGKSVLLNRLARAVADPAADREAVGSIIENDRGQRRSFANLVSVSFSAFDDLPSLPEDDESFPATHVGLRVPSSGTRAPRMKSQWQLKRDFADSVEACLTGEQGYRWLNALRTLTYAGSGLLEEGWLEDFQTTASPSRRRAKARKLFAGLSAGHKVVLLSVTRLVEHVGERTLVIIDEPETHLHPPLLSAFIRVLSDLLTDRNGLAIIATHSPVVLQEVPADCVWKLRRYGDLMAADRPGIETFGENVGVLTREVFGLEVTASGFHRELSSLVDCGESYESIQDRFHHRLGAEARIITRSLIALRDHGDAAWAPEGMS